MKKRLQIILSDEAWVAVESVTNDANQGFDVGNINYSDAINEMILSSKVDIKTLQAKHTDPRRALRMMASKESIDIDSIIKSLMDLKSKTGRRRIGSVTGGASFF